MPWVGSVTYFWQFTVYVYRPFKNTPMTDQVRRAAVEQLMGGPRGQDLTECNHSTGYLALPT
jgi:hypothetical protein